MSESGAPASTSAAETTSVRGVAFGWAKVAVSITMPAISAAASAPSPASSGTPSRAARSVTISQVAAAVGLDPVGGLGGIVRGVVVDDHPGQPREQVGVARADLADPLERAAVGDDQQVVGRGRCPGRSGSARRPT